MSKNDPQVFICFQKDDDGEVSAMRSGRSIKHAEKILEEEPPYNDSSEDEIPNKGESANQDEIVSHPTKHDSIGDVCYRLLNSLDKSLTPYHSAIELTTLFRYGLQKAGIEAQIYNTVKNSSELVNSGELFETFAISPKLHDKLTEGMNNIEEIDQGMKVLPSSLLLSIVATFDSIIGDFLKDLITRDPASIDFGDKSFSYRELFKTKEIETLKNNIIDDEVNRLLRDSHKEQVRYIEKLSQTEIINHHERWRNFYEVFERRNQYAHANGVATRAYLEKLKREKYPSEDIAIGSRLELSTSYLHKAVDYLIEFGTLLSFVIWRKGSDDPNPAFGALSDASYFYITKKRTKLAAWLLDFALHKQSRKGVEEMRVRQMYVNLANALRKKDKKEDSEKVLAELDWSATSIDFRICIASIREDVEEVIRLLPAAAASEDISIDAIRNWPVFDWVRSNDKFRDKFFEVFGEQLIIDFESSLQEMPDKPKRDVPESTVH